MEEQYNVKNPLLFSTKLQDMLNGMYDFFESTFEKEYPKETNGVIHIVGKKNCFQVADQYQRPHDFLQSLLDILQVIYEPKVLGTFFLNSNPKFLFDAIPEKPFQLGYASFISEPHQRFNEFWSENILNALKEYGYNLENTTALFVVVSTGNERYSIDLVNEVCETLDAGFSPEEAIGLIKSSINNDFPIPYKKTFAGYCLVPELDEKLRVSLWMFNQ